MELALKINCTTEKARTCTDLEKGHRNNVYGIVIEVTTTLTRFGSSAENLTCFSTIVKKNAQCMRTVQLPIGRYIRAQHKMYEEN